MERILQDVNAVVGVTGSFVCDGEGKVLARVLPSVFDGATLSTVTRIASQTVAGLETARRRKVTDLDLVYGDGRLVVKNLRDGCLCILCVRNINVPLLNLTANLAARKLSERIERSPKGRGAEMVATPVETLLVEERPVEEVPPLVLSLEEEARRAISLAQERKVILRTLGSVAVMIHCPSTAYITVPFTMRELDFAIYGRQRLQVSEILESLGYEPHQRFNALQGHQRLRFFHPGKEILVHVFVDAFEMCHKLNFAHRLHLDEVTIPLADLLLSKLQVVEMNEEELREIYALVYDHELGGQADPEKIDTAFIVNLCSDDWGWYKTVAMNIERAIALAEDLLDQQEREVFLTRIGRLKQLIEGSPKSLRWQLRARVGESSRWYEVPEEL